jgi:hypothetical protein
MNNLIQKGDIQEANVSGLIDQKLKENSNIPVYIVAVDDPRNENSYKQFVCTRVTECSNYLEIIGFSADTKTINAIKSINEVNNIVQKKNIKYENHKFSWTKVIDINNITYKKSIGDKK